MLHPQLSFVHGPANIRRPSVRTPLWPARSPATAQLCGHITIQISCWCCLVQMVALRDHCVLHAAAITAEADRGRTILVQGFGNVYRPVPEMLNHVRFC